MRIRFDTVLFHYGVWNLFTETGVSLVIYVVSNRVTPVEMLLDMGKKSDIEYDDKKNIKLILVNDRYIRHPNGENVTKEFVENGNYEIEAMGKRYTVDLCY
ncbi:hypothetical protein K0M31_013229 [Melipona bicolor]|uniref:Uncharacterized protein n=1 Tax=Melipona bicolor TaxID=60889 RepID=A0AA40FHY9_9HYME|nr:hypothetical protein K0M31_013229 [Melipona bicolor]